MKYACCLGLLVLGLGFDAPANTTAAQPEKEGGSPRKSLYAYLQADAQKHFDARRKTVAGLKTPDDLKRRQEQLKAKFLEALGGFPDKTPLNARVVGQLKGDGFRVEKVIYESRPD